MRSKEVRQLVKYVRGCEGWTVTGAGPYQFRAPGGDVVHVHGTINSRTLANRLALLRKLGLPRPDGRG